MHSADRDKWLIFNNQCRRREENFPSMGNALVSQTTPLKQVLVLPYGLGKAIESSVLNGSRANGGNWTPGTQNQTASTAAHSLVEYVFQFETWKAALV
jgi:hypothetical protein